MVFGIQKVNTDEAYLPITVDSSQLRAIYMTSAGVSLALHGPSGSGKSLAIVAMVANALMRGKKALFAAEMMDAMEAAQISCGICFSDSGWIGERNAEILFDFPSFSWDAPARAAFWQKGENNLYLQEMGGKREQNRI